MRSGKLRHLLTIESIQSVKPVGPGDVPSDYATFATVWGSVEPMSGRELIAAGAVQDPTTHKITIRYVPGVTAQMRVKYVDRTGATRYFNILSVTDKEERGRELQIEAQEGLSDG